MSIVQKVSSLALVFGLACAGAVSPGNDAYGQSSGVLGEDLIFFCGFECSTIPSVVTLREYSQTHASGGMGAPWGTALGSDQLFNAGNKPVKTTPLTPPTEFRIRAWSFTAPEAALTGFIQNPVSGNHVTLISSCPGDLDVFPVCRINGGNSQMKWSTRPTEVGACLLVPGQTYYLQAAHFSLTNYISTGTILNTCGCSNPPCPACKASISATQAY